MEEITLQGVWWLPENPDRAAPGTLTFRDSERPVLNLIGSLHDRDFSEQAFEPQFVLGLATTGKKVTLYRCLEVNRSFNLGGGLGTSRISASVLFIGEHFSEAKDLVFERFAVSYDHLSDWAWLSGFEYSITQDRETHKFQRYELTYAFPDPQEVQVGELRIRFAPTFNQSGGPITAYHLDQHLFLEVRPSSPMEFDGFLDTFYHLRNFITLGVGHPIHPVRMRATVSVELDEEHPLERPHDVQVYYRVDRAGMAEKSLHPAEMLFNFPKIRPYFEQTLVNWFGKASILKPVYDLYFGTLYNPKLYLEGRFLSLAQAVETYHRRMIGGSYVTDAEYEQLKALLLGAITSFNMDSDAKNALMGKVQYLNELSLRRRVKELVVSFDKLVTRHIPNPSKFAGRVVDTRNYLTHYNPSLEPNAVRGENLYLLAEQLRLLLELCFLRELGLPNELMEELVSEHQGYIRLGVSLDRAGAT